MTENQPVIFQTESGAIELKGDFSNDTLWATQQQIVELFGIDQSVVSRHINKVFKSGEVDKESNMQKMHIAHSDRPVRLYSLDIILAVGYRTNSTLAIQFRKWATETLKQHITQGYTLNPSRIEQNKRAFLAAIEDLKLLSSGNQLIQSDDLLSLVTAFAQTWFSLEAYDRDRLPSQGRTEETIPLEAGELYRAVDVLKQDLIKRSQATPLFAQEKTQGSLEGILGNIYQSVFGQDAYPTVEEKAAHLLYFIVKNHPFNDGNKRTGAFAFIWFLQKAGGHLKNKISPEALTAITLLIAESDPKNMARMIGLVILLLTGEGQQ